MKLKPLADRVILKQFKAEEKTKSGLILAAFNGRCHRRKTRLHHC